MKTLRKVLVDYGPPRVVRAARVAQRAVHRVRYGSNPIKRRADERIRAHVATRTEGVVAGGPFRGMRWPLEPSWNNPVLYLTGSYESPLHPALEEAIRSHPSIVVDVGCAEGYYAVGMARRLPHATVHAFDTDVVAQSRCERMARENDVSQRVHVRGTCSAAELDALAGPGTLFIVDCEGAEIELLQPDLAPNLRSSTVIVELHDAVDLEITRTIVERFSPTHQTQLLTARTDAPDTWPTLRGLPHRLQRRAMNEWRPTVPHPMHWAVLRPRHVH